MSDLFEPLLCPICGKNTIGRNQPPECQHTRREIFEYANALLAKIEAAKEALEQIDNMRKMPGNQPPYDIIDTCEIANKALKQLEVE